MGKPAPVSVFMTMLATISIALVTVTVTTAADSSRNILADVRPPKLPPNPFWGPSEREEERVDVSIRPFQISVPAAVLDDLRTRLSLETSPSGNRLVPPLEGTGFTYGYNSEHLSSVTSYWLQEYLPAWSAREQGLNKYPHFKTRIYGLDIHFQHVKSTSTDTKGYKVTRPLLLLHGWPGSFVEFQKLIPLLTDPPGSDINFELIIPSLPGYGFSEPASVPGLGPAQVAQLFDTLMARLGHDKYYVQGGDWGSQIGSNIAAMFPERARGLHVNMCVTLAPKAFLRHGVASVFPTLFMSKDEARIGYPLKRILPAIIEETGYFHLQSTKPDTIGVALSNSPSGLAAYVLEKFSLWTNLQWNTRSDGGLGHFQLNELLDNLMVYWATNTITTSMRFYSEAMSSEQRSLNMDRVPVSVPTACLQPPEEVVYALSRWALISKYLNLRRYNVAARGGHFLAFEEPALLAKDVTAYFRSLENSDTF